jgi:hypothetical protein
MATKAQEEISLGSDQKIKTASRMARSQETGFRSQDSGVRIRLSQIRSRKSPSFILKQTTVTATGNGQQASSFRLETRRIGRSTG